ncbi:MAG: rod shape-determining protein MreC [Bacteroidaceae bacterium]|nr:rod shape-determining protein MreC [Bacteroidaceae bacterium]
MRALFDFIARQYHWMMLIVLEGLSLMLLFQFNHYQGSVWLTNANSVVGYLMEQEQRMLNYLSLTDVNAELSHRNMLLEHNIKVLTAELNRLTHDSTFTERKVASQLAGVELIPAKVVNNSVRLHDNYITINRGSVDGVQPEMGVVSGTGVVGIVYMTSDHYSIVLPLLNSKSRLSSRLRGSNYFGYLRWDGRNPLSTILDDIPHHARCKVGDVVETSGYSSVFPSGIFIGRVSRIENSEDGMGYQLHVRLGIDFANLQDVSVIATRGHGEQQELEEQAH